MKKRILALALAVVLAVAPAGNVLAAEILSETAEGDLEQDWTAQESAQSENGAQPVKENEPENVQILEEAAEPDEEESPDEAQTEALADASDETQAAFWELSGDGLVLDIEEVETKDYAASGAEVIVAEENSEQASESGLVSTATHPRLRLYSNAQYVDSYGGQLSGDAKALYDQMVAAYVTNRGFGQLTFTFEEPLTFAVEGTLQTDETGKSALVWDSDNNEEYQEVLTVIRYAVQASYDAFIYDYPEVFWIGAPTFGWSTSFKGSGSVNFTGTGIIESIKVTPGERYEGATLEISAFDAAVDAAYAGLCAKIPEGASRKDVVRAIHDDLCETVSYAENEYARTAAGVFIKSREVVCEGYAKSFKVLCDRFGIESVLIPGGAQSSSGIEGHMWNYVKMEDGVWYLVDVTWDDQKSYISDTYFLVGNQSMNSRGMTIYEEREQNRYTNFSNSAYTQSFAFPELSDCAYHVHVWTQYVSDGNATCAADGTKTAVCDVEGCKVRNTVTNEGSKDLAEHQLQHVAAKAATCITAGNVEYWYCSVCGKYFGDAAGTNEISQSSTILPAAGHRLQHVAAKTATCITAGNLEYWYCSVCGKYFGDAAGTNEISQSSTVLPATGVHSYGSYVVTKAPTAVAEGIETRTCTVAGCGAAQTRTIPRLKGTITLNVKSLTLKVGQSTSKVTVSGLAAGDKIASWSSSNSKIATVSKKGVIKGIKAGTAKITVKLASGTTGTISVKVQKTTVKTTKISGLSKKLTIQKGKKSTLTPVITPITSQEKITYSSSNKAVATVSSKGVVTAKKAGTAKITVKSGSKKFVVTVTVPKTATTAIKNVSSSVSLKKGKTLTLKPKLTPANSDYGITYKSSNAKVAAVSAKGKITAKKKGTAVITVKSGSISVKCKVTVK